MALELDARRRAMLQEMGVRLWLPGDPPPNEMGLGAGAPRAESRSRPERPKAATAAPAVSEPIPVGPLALRVDPAAGAIDVAEMDWPVLRETVASCRACGLCEGRTNTVFGVGPARADWLIVGEAPGEQEDLQAQPFVGASGQLLDNMLRSIGLHRSGQKPANRNTRANVFITNVLKCRPPGNRNPEPQEVAQCAPYLRRQIELLQPRLILALGRFASQSLLQGSVADVERIALGRLRGTVHSYQAGSKKLPVVVSYHPAYLLRNLPAKALAWADLCLALEVMRQT